MAVKKAEVEHVETITPSKAIKGKKEAAVVASSRNAESIAPMALSKLAQSDAKNVEKARLKAEAKAIALMTDYNVLDDAIMEMKRKQDAFRKQVIELMQPYIANDTQNVRFGDSLLSKTVTKATAQGSEVMMESMTKLLPEEAFISTRTVNWDYVLQRPEWHKKASKIGIAITKKESHRLK